MSRRSTWHGIVQIFRFARKEWLLLALALLAMAAYAACEGAYLWIAKPFLDAFGQWRKGKGEAGISVEELYFYGKAALCLAPVVAVAAFCQFYLQQRVVWKLSMRLRNAVCRAVLPQSLSFFESRRSGDLMSRITNDVTSCRSVFMLLYGDIPEQCLHLVMGLGLAFAANWRLLFLCAAAAPLTVLPTSYLARKIRRYGREGLEKLADLTDQMAQMFSGIRVIKAFKMEEAEAQEFERVNRKLFSKMMKMAAARGASAGTIELVIRGFMGLGILIGTWLLVTNRLDARIGELVVCLGGMYYAFQATRKLVKVYNELQSTIPAADRVFDLIEHAPALRDAPDAVRLETVRQGVAFRNVSFSYGGEQVLRGISFEVRKGQTVAIVGRSGAGKSTLVALIPRFYEVTEGAVEIDGIDVRRIARDSLLDRFAIVTQQTFLFNRSIADNIRYGKPDATMEQIEQAARMANIHDFIVSQPEGYDALCGEFGSKLSGGQRQRIAIARAILKNADILILDEALVGLDAESEMLVREALANLMRGRTTFVITHDLPTIQNADLILVLSEGRLVAKGTHQELMAQEGEYRTLYAMQFATLPTGPAAPRPLSEY